jgi:hypothetical protein
VTTYVGTPETPPPSPWGEGSLFYDIEQAIPVAIELGQRLLEDVVARADVLIYRLTGRSPPSGGATPPLPRQW